MSYRPALVLVSCVAALTVACGRARRAEGGDATTAGKVDSTEHAGIADSGHASTEASTGADTGKGAEAEPGRGGEDAAPPPVVSARTALATVQPFAETMSAIGMIAPRPGRYAELSAPAPTRVARIFVTAGQTVAAGDPLVEFDRAAFDAAAAAAASALTVAEHNYERAQRLSAAGILPRKDVDQAAADLAQAQTTAVTARRAQELATLRAPIAGVVTHLSAVLGASVDATQPVVGVADPHGIDVVLNLSPADGARVHAGDSVSVTAGQGGVGEPLGTGIVETVGAALDTASRTLAVRARLDHPRRTLRIWETVSGRITTAVNPHALTVPVAALVPEGDAIKVFVVGSDGLAHARPVTIGGRSESVAEITTGLKPGERVVTEGAYGVEDSARVVQLK